MNGEDDGSLIAAIAGRGDQKAALQLIEQGADVDEQDADGTPAVAYAAAMGRTKTFDALVKRGADLYRVDRAGRSIVRHMADSIAGSAFCAAPSSIPAVRRIARKFIGTLPAQPEDELLLLLIADAYNDLREALANGLDANQVIRGSAGILGVTIDHLREGIQEAGGLLEAMADGTLIPSTQEQLDKVDGYSLLMWAVGLQSVECVKVLLSAGADPHRQNRMSISAMSIAERRSDNLKDILKLHSATGLDAPPRAMAIGADPSRVREEVNRLLQHFSDETDIGLLYRVQDLWELASLQHVLADDRNRDAAIGQIAARCVPDYLAAGQHAQKYWHECFSAMLASAAIVGDEENLVRLVAVPRRSFDRGERSPKYNPEWYEWPIWQYMAGRSEDRRRCDSVLDEMQFHSTPKSKAMLACLRAIEANDAKQAAKSIDRIVAAEDAHAKKMWNSVLPRTCLSAVACFFLHYAGLQGLSVAWQANWNLRVVESHNG